MEDLNELLGSDSEDEIEVTKDTENDAKKDALADLLGENIDDERQGAADNDEKIVDTKTFEDNVGIDELEQILGKSTIPSTIPNKKVKQTSKLHINEVKRIPVNAKSLFVRTPNFLKINSKEFDPDTYDPENEKELNAATIIRWRVRKGPTGEIVVGKDGKPQLESNARLIKWDDGTYQLVIGKAIFNSKIMATDNLYTFQEHKNQDTLVNENGNNVEDGVTVRGGNCLECIGAVDNRMILQPLSLNSSTHARVSLKISERFKKENRIVRQEHDANMMPPEKLLDQLAKQEEEEIRAVRKLQLQAMEYRQSSGYGGGDLHGPSRGAASAGKSRPSMSSSYLDDNDQFDGDIGGGYLRRSSESAKKKKKKKKKASPKRARRRDDEDDDQDGEDLGDEDSEDDEDEDDDGQENDSIVVDDDDEEEDDGEEDDAEEEDDDDEDDEDDDDNVSNDEAGEARKKEKKDKKKKKLSKKEKKSSRTDKKNKKKKDKKKDESRKVVKTKRTSELEGGNNSVAADGDGEDDEENLNLHYNKRLKRTVIESDDEDDA